MMITFQQAALELFVQITLWSAIGIFLLMMVNRYFPLRLAPVALCFLAGIVLLTALVWLPWPTWVSMMPQASSPVGGIEHLPAVDAAQGETGFNFTLALKSWQQLMPKVRGESTDVRQEGSAGSWAWWGLTLFALGMVFSAIRLLLALRHTRFYLASSTELHDEGLCQTRDELAKRLGLRTAVCLLESPTLSVPATVGCWKPAILLPRNWICWTTEDRRTVLAHELAHIRRTDYFMMVMTQIITIFYWFHPLVRGLSRWMRCGQELAADALAVRVLGDQASYLRSLCRLALDQDGARLPAPARLFLSPEVSLLRRIAMLREGSPRMPGSRKSVRWLVMMGLIVAGAVVASMRSSTVADEPENKTSATTAAWLKYVDPHAPGYLICRPAAAMSLDSMQPHREALNRMFKSEIGVLPRVGGMGVPLDAVECFAGPIQVQLRKNGEKGTGSLTVRGVYFQMRTKADVETWIKYCMFSVEKMEHKLGTYYKANHSQKAEVEPAYFLRPDERTIIFGESEKEVLGWLANSSKPQTLPAWLQGVPQDTGIITLAVNMQSDLVRDTLKQASDGAVMNPMFKPIYQHDGSMICTLSKSDQLTFQLRLSCTDAEAAGKKKKHLDALSALLKVVQVSGTTNADPAKEAADHQLIVDLMNNLKSHQDGNLLQFNTHCNLTLGDAIKEQIVEIQGKVEKK